MFYFPWCFPFQEWKWPIWHAYNPSALQVFPQRGDGINPLTLETCLYKRGLLEVTALHTADHKEIISWAWVWNLFSPLFNIWLSLNECLASSHTLLLSIPLFYCPLKKKKKEYGTSLTTHGWNKHFPGTKGWKDALSQLTLHQLV